MAEASSRPADRATLPAGGRTTAMSQAATPALTLIYHPDPARAGERAVLEGLLAGKEALLSRSEPDFGPPGHAGGAPLDDDHLSRKPLRLTALGDGGVRLDTAGSGTPVVFQGKPVQRSMLFTARDLRRGVVLELARRVVLLLHLVTVLPGDAGPVRGDIAGESDGTRLLLWDIENVADLPHPVLLRGESGTGKELAAQALHRASGRRNGPFVAVNLGAIPATLAASELFGVERGGYTGAVPRKGYFEQAHRGTLFLDEVGDAPAEIQIALLRALESKKIQPVGAAKLRDVDVRVIAATDADLEAKVAGGAFRAPLLNRLAAYEIRIPPLRERRDDIGRLFIRFLREELDAIGEARRLERGSPEHKLWMPASIVARIADHDWPGNIRQLRNVVRHLVIGNRRRERVEMTAAVERLLNGSGREDATRDEQEPEVSPDIEEPPPPPSDRPPARRKPADLTEEELAEALREARFEATTAADLLGIPRASMYMLIERHARFRTAAQLTPEEIQRCHEECGGVIARMVEKLEVSERALTRRLRDLGLVVRS